MTEITVDRGALEYLQSMIELDNTREALEIVTNILEGRDWKTRG